jgi:hypothetical protein
VEAGHDLTRLPARAGEPYTEEEAAVEADEVMASRMQNLVFTLDKVKLFLRHQPRNLRVRPSLQTGIRQTEPAFVQCRGAYIVLVDRQTDRQTGMLMICCRCCAWWC